MRNVCTFRRSVNLPVSASKAFSWHERKGALMRLSPPWDPIRVVYQEGILPGSRTRMIMHAGPVPYRWDACHTAYEKNIRFQDIQTRGPFAEWTHTHEFSDIGPEQSRLTDTISWRLPVHAATGAAMKNWVNSTLSRIFAWRHRTLKSDLTLHSAHGETPLKIAISGASGVIGSQLIPFLTTGGHEVFSLVRRSPRPDSGEIHWNPETGDIDASALSEMDAVIHLAGEPVGNARWSQAKKSAILRSRIRGTTLLAETIAALPHGPRIFLSASAIGYYGDRGNTPLSEYDTSGDLFISEVCREWERATAPAEAAGIRTAHLRIGVVLTPGGGALHRLLPLHRAGLSFVIGNGGQYLSWIGIDDVLGAIYHVLHTRSIRGPVNITAPNPVPAARFSRTLARETGSLAAARIPAGIVKTAFGRMGEETLLASARVMPARLTETGFRFRHPDISPALRHLLGNNRSETDHP